MALPGETGHIGTVCPDCKQTLVAKVLPSGAGWYIGTRCECGPYSRESFHYYPSAVSAQLALDSGEWKRR